MGVFRDLGDKIYIKGTGDEIDKTRFDAFVKDAIDKYRTLCVNFAQELQKLKDEKEEEFAYLGVTIVLCAGTTNSEEEFRPDILCMSGEKNNLVHGIEFAVRELQKQALKQKENKG